MSVEAEKIRILIVDDDEDDFFLAQDLLEEIGQATYCLEWASTFDKGLERLRDNEHHLCLMDYKLGAEDGIELLAQAQQQGFTGPVILLTGMRQGKVDIQALEAGAVDYLVKAELTAEQLERSIRYALARREVELERIERLRAESENRSKSEFLAHLSHELRTPLSAVLGFTELLLNKAEKPEEQSHLQVIQRNGKYLLGLLNDILDLSKIEAGKLELEPQWLNLSTFLSDTFLLMQGTALDKNLTFNLEATTELPLLIRTDPTRLRQVLLNLIGNGLKFTDQGGVTVTVALEQGEPPALIRFTITDTGVGIPEADLQTIFDPFVQSSGANLNATPGTGLGLAISRQLAEQLGGDIEVRSELGIGSQFVVTIAPELEFPLTTQPFVLKQDLDVLSSSEIPQFSGQVLVVDDLEDIRSLISHFVRLTGAHVETATNGQEALERLRKKSYDLVLMDLNMPVKDGIETAQQLAKEGYQRPLVALTAANMKGDREQCLSHGFNRYLSKPIDQNNLYKCLRRYLPLADSQTAVVAPSPSVRAKTVATATPAQETILLVEDNDDARLALAELLNLSGYSVLPVANASAALAALKEQPQIVITDLNLPDQDGYQLAADIQSQAPHLPIIALSGEAIEAERANASGIDHHMLKPVNLTDLQDMLEQLTTPTS